MRFMLNSTLAAWDAICVARWKNVICPLPRPAARRQTYHLAVTLLFATAIAIPSLLCAAPAPKQGGSPDAQRQILGSLNSAGEVYVNESKAPTELTIFAGDTVRIGQTGTAMLTTSNGNSFQISALSQVVFAGDPRYFAELKMGTISVKVPGGTSGAAVRAGDSAIVPTNRNERTVVTIERTANGSFLVTCTMGNIGILPMNQSQGLFLQAGQAARISPNGELSADQGPAGSTASGAAQTAGKRHMAWIYVGMAGAGAGAAAGIALAVANHSPVSPSAP